MKIEKYKLAKGGAGLLAYFKPRGEQKLSFYHIHEKELTEKQRVIRDNLRLCLKKRGGLTNP